MDETYFFQRDCEKIWNHLKKKNWVVVSDPECDHKWLLSFNEKKERIIKCQKCLRTEDVLQG